SAGRSSIGMRYHAKRPSSTSARKNIDVAVGRRTGTATRLNVIGAWPRARLHRAWVTSSPRHASGVSPAGRHGDYNGDDVAHIPANGKMASPVPLLAGRGTGR